MRVVVTGGRDYQDYDYVRELMLALSEKGGPLEIAHGGAGGADSLAEEVAHVFGWPVKCYPANWRQFGPAAGPIRNRQMLVDFSPELVVAFPGGRGTEHCVKTATGLGIAVLRAAREVAR